MCVYKLVLSALVLRFDDVCVKCSISILYSVTTLTCKDSWTTGKGNVQAPRWGV